MTRLLLRKRPDVHVAAVVPAFNVATELGEVLRQMPMLFRTIIVVDDNGARLRTPAINAEHELLCAEGFGGAESGRVGSGFHPLFGGFGDPAKGPGASENFSLQL